MDIKLIRNFNGALCIPLQGSVVLLISGEDYRLDRYAGKCYSLVDVDSNSKQEIMPDVNKYDIYEFTDVTGSSDYVWFTTGTEGPDGEIEVSIVRYSIADAGSEIIHSERYSASSLADKKIRVIIADENYLIVQTQRIVSSNSDTAYTMLEDIYLYGIMDKSRLPVSDALLAKEGIDCIIPVDGNICAIKAGSSNLEYKLYGNDDALCRGREAIAIVNLRQLLSDLVLKKEKASMEILDENNADETFPYMKVMNGSIIYSKVNLSMQKEDIVTYDYASNVTKLRVNDSIRVADASSTYLINDTMYYLQEDERCTKLINLNTQKCDWKLGSDYRIRYIYNNVIVVSKHVPKRLFFKGTDYIFVYRFPDTQNYVLCEKAYCVECAVTDNDDLLIFCC